ATGRRAELGPREWSDGAAVTVVLAAEGYPGTPVPDGVLDGLDAAAAVPGAAVLHAGTRRDDQGRVVAAGGRVLSVVGTGADVPAARTTAYAALAHVRLAGSHYRTDIASAASSPK
ncbi:MAG: phosphoribosylglycinamide synthetase C domain-containing protein, partial [Actinomycetes bacterium]